jgi:hypothetical protein
MLGPIETKRVPAWLIAFARAGQHGRHLLGMDG